MKGLVLFRCTVTWMTENLQEELIHAELELLLAPLTHTEQQNLQF